MSINRQVQDKQIKGYSKQPQGLYILFFTELWERFSYYGMRALFILYMTNALMFSDQKSYLIYGTYGTLVYITPIIGGTIADRLFGYRRAIIFGGVLMAFGQFSLMIKSLDFFYLGLALLIVGNGLLKPNVASLLGKLYGPTDPRRDPGFTLFYVGVNIGSFFAPILCGFVGQLYGWRYGFGLAGVGMLLGLLVFIRGMKHMQGHGKPPSLDILNMKFSAFIPINISTLTNIGILLMVPLVIALFVIHITGWLLLLTGIIVFGSLIIMALKSPPKERNHIFAILIFMALAMIFWSFQEQAGSSLNLFTERDINRTLFGYTIPTAMFQAVNPVFIILFGPLLANLWQVFNRYRVEPPTTVKFGLGIVQLGLGFAIVAAGAKVAEQHQLASMIYLIMGYLFMTTGELCLEPIGIAMVTRLSPVKLVGLMMGCWYLADGSFSNYIAAKIAALTSVPRAEIHDPVLAAQLYHNVFNEIAIIAGVIGVIVIMISPLMKRLV